MVKKLTRGGSETGGSSNLRIVFKLGGSASNISATERSDADSSDGEDNDSSGAVGVSRKPTIEHRNADDSSSNCNTHNKPHTNTVIKLKLQPASPGEDGTSRKRARAQSEESVGGGKKRRSRGTSPAVPNTGLTVGSVPLADKGDALMEALRKIHVNLVVKDTYQFFQVPVDPSQAPQYTEIITRPMDFGTMFTKLEAEEYGSIDDYRADFELMCNNAMTYNMEATIYHKSAKRLLKQGLALIRKETKVHARILKQLEKEAKQAATKRREKSVSVALTSDEEDDSMMELEGPASPGDAEEEVYVGGLMQRQPSTMLEAQTLRHYATEAARNASNAINRSESRPHPLVFDRKGNLMFADEDTAAKMNFLTNERANAVCGKTLGEELAELPISYPTFYTKAALAAASTSGVPAKSGAPQPVTHVTGASQTNQLHLCAQLLTGPYSSHLPKADNRYSKLTAAQQKVVESTFGDEHVYSYACSLRKRAENIAIAPDGERDRVDSLITKLTDNRYKRTEWPSRSLDSEIQTLGVDKTPPVSAEELKVLVALSKEDGVDMKWLDTMFKPRDENIRRTPECVQDVLDDTSGLLWELEKVQAIRKAVGNTSSYKPEERALAQEIVTRLKQLLSIAYPQ